jgi:hypothetical protein
MRKGLHHAFAKPFTSWYQAFCLLMVAPAAVGQDSTLQLDRKTITLKEVVVRSNLNVPAFIQRVQFDTSFYKAFKNLRVVSFTALNDVRMLNKKQALEASLQSKTRQHAWQGCRFTEVLSEKTQGPIRNRKGEWNYYTMELYAGLMFASDTICGESNLVKGSQRAVQGKSGMDKRKEQLKMLFFDPGKRIPGIPLMGDKTAIFEEDMQLKYDYILDVETYAGEPAYTLLIRAKTKESGARRGDVVINEMKTWFDTKKLGILARTYDLSYDAGVYDFDVQMEVQLSQVGDLFIPSLIRYTGAWFALSKKRERGVFTATIVDVQQ